MHRLFVLTDRHADIQKSRKSNFLSGFPDSRYSMYHIPLPGKTGASQNEGLLAILTLRQIYPEKADNLEWHPVSPLIRPSYTRGK